MTIEEIEKKIKEKGYDLEWSLCKAIIAEEPRYFFRLLNLNIPEACGDTISEAVERYLLDLPNKTKEEKR